MAAYCKGLSLGRCCVGDLLLSPRPRLCHNNRPRPDNDSQRCQWQWCTGLTLLVKQMWCFLRAGGVWPNHAYLWTLLHSKAIACNVLQQFLWNILLCEMSLLHSLLQSRILCPYLDIKEMDLIVSPLKQAFNSILWGIKTLLNNWAAKRLVISVFIAHIDLSVVNPFKYPCHTGPDGSL